MENLMKKIVTGIAYTWLVLAVVIGTAGFVTFVGNSFDKLDMSLSDIKQATVNVATVAAQAKSKPTLDNKISKVVADNKESVVYIEISIKDEYKEEADRRGASGGGLGTGWFVRVDDDYSYIVTNHHVIEAKLKADKYLNLRVYDMITPWGHDTEIVGYDEIADLAVLKIKTVPQLNWRALKWADHAQTEPGDSVVVIGHGMGLPWSMSSGIVTATDRWMVRQMNLMIQSDAVVNKGNSGGPMLNLDGEVIGVVDAILDPGGKQSDSAAYAGVSLVIAGFQAERAVNQIIAFGEANYPYFDFKVANPEREDYVMQWGDVYDQSMVIVDSAPEGTKAYDAGLREGDYLVALDGKRLTGMVSLVRLVLHHNAGDIVEFVVNRNGEEHTISYELENFKDYQE